MDIAHIEYTLKHKIAFLRVEKRMLGHNTIRGYLHDLDKIVMYLVMNAQKAHKIHTSRAKHHHKNAKTRKHRIQMLIDWECARFTKSDKPLDAWETMYKYYPELELELKPLMFEFSLDKGRVKPDDTVENPDVWDKYFYGEVQKGIWTRIKESIISH